MKIPLLFPLFAGITFYSLVSLTFSHPTPPPSPKIEFEETTYDAGEVLEGEKVIHIFKFKNAGNSSLHIKKVRTSCGCTAALVSKKNIEPGEGGEIEVKFNTKRYKGNQKKTIYVSTNDPLYPTLQLKLSAQVKSLASFSPRTVDFGKVTRGEKVSRLLRLIPEGDHFKIIEVEAQPEFFQAKLLDETLAVGEDNKSVQIEVTLSPHTPLGRHRGKLTVYTDHPRVPQLKAPLHARIEGLVQYSPRIIFFSLLDQKKTQAKKVRLIKKGDADLEIKSVQTTLPQFKVEVVTIKPFQEYEIIIRPEDNMKPGQFRGKVIVHTNQEEQKEIKIPLTANAR